MVLQHGFFGLLGRTIDFCVGIGSLHMLLISGLFKGLQSLHHLDFVSAVTWTSQLSAKTFSPHVWRPMSYVARLYMYLPVLCYMGGFRCRGESSACCRY